jgi:GNAT superfamily N-acetyltransferase
MNAQTEPLRIVRRALDHPDARRLVDEVQAEYAGLYGTADHSPIDVREFEADAGAFYVAHLGAPGGASVGTVAWRRVPTPTSLGGDAAGASAELKRMFVRPEHRRAGLARQLLSAVEDAARDAGVRWMVQETGLRQPEAIALYASSGYEALSDFGHYTATGLARSFAKDLSVHDR